MKSLKTITIAVLCTVMLLSAFGAANFQKLQEVTVDDVTHAMVVVQEAEHKLHEGEDFVATDIQSIDTTTFKWQITTPDTTKISHMVFHIESTGEILVLITEGSDRVDGAAMAEINRNRLGTPNVAGTIVTSTPTGGTTDGAVILDSYRVGSTAQGGQVSVSGERGSSEFMLKPDTKYVISVTTFAAIHVTFNPDWLEHTAIE